ncbi:DoxX family protein [Maribius pontilimi]|uniref:DoxX family protein n=1 Tax=Palleronia pontilimi TaxID=1964209 RepID=A0A934MH39_9RHOB|nr:DoxX family protein [Palleronia pontilimi]MBJ3762979.1 DoxX family protein [Palleronia pontilimi]
MLPHSPISSLSLPVIRILIGSYFLASIGLIDNFGSVDILSALVPERVAQVFTASVLYATSLSVMLGLFVRPAALILAIFFFWSSFIQHSATFSFHNLTEFWRDMALVGSVLLIAATTPSSVRLRLKRKTPRRVRVGTNPFDGRTTLGQAANTVVKPGLSRARPRPQTEEPENIFREMAI